MSLELKTLEQKDQKEKESKEKQEELRQEITVLKRDIHELEDDYEAELKKSVEEGVDNDEKLKEINKQIKDKREELEIAEAKLKALGKGKGGVSKQEIWNEFYTEWLQKFRQNKADPALKELKQAADQYRQAVEKYKRVNDEFKRAQKELVDELGEGYEYKIAGLNPLDFKTADQRATYTITEAEAKELRRLFL